MMEKAREKIIGALTHCVVDENCTGCPFDAEASGCEKRLLKRALWLVQEQRAIIAELEAKILRCELMSKENKQ